MSAKSTAGFMFLTALFLLIPGISAATVVKALSIEDMSVMAQEIVVGQVVSQEAKWDQEGNRIYTYTTIQVEQNLKGRTTQGVIVVRQPGGEVGPIGMKVQGVAAFKNGEEVLVFLSGSVSRQFRLLGMAQGKLSINTDAVTGKKIATQQLLGMKVQNISGPATTPKAATTWTLEELKGRINAALASSTSTEGKRP